MVSSMAIPGSDEGHRKLFARTVLRLYSHDYLCGRFRYRRLFSRLLCCKNIRGICV